MKDYAQFYKWLSAPFRRYPSALTILKGFNQVLTAYMYLLYPFILGHLLVKRQWQDLFLNLALPALSFVAVSFFRHYYNRPRPYESWEIEPLLQKETRGHSLPSRHIFSACLISCLSLQLSPELAALNLFLSAILGLIRVIGGVHYPRDIFWGYGLGLLSGLLTALIGLHS